MTPGHFFYRRGAPVACISDSQLSCCSLTSSSRPAELHQLPTYTSCPQQPPASTAFPPPQGNGVQEKSCLLQRLQRVTLGFFAVGKWPIACRTFQSCCRITLPVLVHQGRSNVIKVPCSSWKEQVLLSYGGLYVIFHKQPLLRGYSRNQICGCFQQTQNILFPTCLQNKHE